MFLNIIEVQLNTIGVLFKYHGSNKLCYANRVPNFNAYICEYK